MDLLQIVFVFSLTLSLVFCQYKIVFDQKNSPPSIVPRDPKDYVYSVPLNQLISRPIIAFIQFQNGSRIRHGPLSSEIYEVSTMDEKEAHSRKNIDLWAIKGGRLCQKSNWERNYPERLNRKTHKVRCGSNKRPTTLTLKAFEGKLIMDWLFHQHQYNSIPTNKRVISVFLPRKFLRAYSHSFLVTDPAHHLAITQNPPITITANHDFSISAEIRFENGSVVDTGIDSTLNVDVTVPYYYKVFNNQVDRRMILKRTKYRLSGNESSLHQGNYDWIIRKRAVRGRVTFDGIRILDPGKGLKLNLTMTMNRDPWLRVPQCQHCYEDLHLAVFSADKKEVTFAEPDIFMLRKLLSVKLTTKFDVLDQKLHKLIFDSETIDNMKNLEDPTTKLVHVTRNTGIPGGVTIIASDNAGRRIHAGKDASFKLVYKTIPKSVCVSSDATKRIEGGYGYVLMSICQIINNVTIEIIPNIRATASLLTPSLRVMGHLTVAHLGDFQYSGDGAQVQSHINSFIRFAAEDINKGFMLPSLSRNGFVLNVVPYETKSDMFIAYRALMKMEHALLAKDKTRVIISSTTEAITKVLNPELVEFDVLYISTSNTGNEFSDKIHFPLFNRVCWSEMEILKSVFLACKERMWDKLIVIQQKNAPIHEVFYHLAHHMDITIKATIDIDTSSVIKDEISYFKLEMTRIRLYGTKIIFLVATKEYQPYILRAAQLANLDSLHGYQWILYSMYAWQFPFGNEAVCRVGVPCTKAFRSTYLFSETYNITGYHTLNWIRVLGQYFSVDRFKYKGGRVRYRPPEVGAKMALGYDALLLFAGAVQKIMSFRETIHGKALAEKSRNLQVDGLTGSWKLNSQGDRVGFFCFLAQVNPFTDDPLAPISNMVTFTRTLIHYKDGTQLEIPYKSLTKPPGSRRPQSESVAPVSPKYNIRVYQSVSGMVDQFTQKISRNPSEPWPSVQYMRQEKVTPTFACEQDCGKNLLSKSDINIYDTGRCNIGGRCVCHHGFHGNFCENIDCTCEYGTCLSADRCFCYPGWMGLECKFAICQKCKHGTCTQPELCQCFSSTYFGKACDLHIAMVIGPVLIGGFIIGACITMLVRYLIKHAARNAALANSDWIIDWLTVEQIPPEDLTDSQMCISVDTIENVFKNKNIFIWKNEKWYGEHIDSWTIDSRIQELRLEMVDLVKINHRNLITYRGACLTAPNVYLFQEVADKGSLNNILHSKSIDLGWEFKYSFMKDICSGMKFLHDKPMMGSHGHLKSSNCLVDSRWTVRISGFGAHCIRYGRFRLPKEEANKIKNLFWTAPELLENVTCLDDVKNGTMMGDVYSFAIIVVEILTRAAPYEYEMNYFTDDVILDMITNNDCETRKKAQRTWEEFSGVNMFACRPLIQDEYLPECGLERKQLLKMIDESWNENPAARPSFEKLEKLLTQIHPVKGELIDNLISLLEMYSNNLEMVVIERTKELEVSKARAETLLSQMLPRKVTTEMKKGNKVPPEVFSSATVFFSDIVDFGKICEESSPFQIVDLLNETYNAFDEVLDAYDVFKVETISDSYMVVSGVPEKNGIKHAAEICTMALHLMSTVCNFRIPHKPTSVLQLRIGINSGPVVAGVVGVLMPRYCLFGDTVNTAARMYSSSRALCIQISDSTAELLDEIGGFELESRGQRQIKGRGTMTTYWLWGKDDFEMPMPEQSWAISLSQHKFK